MQEDLLFRLKMDSSQLNAEMGKARAGAANLGGGLGSVTTGLDKIGGKTGADARQALGSLGFVMGGTAGQASALTNVIGDLAGAIAGGPGTIALIASVGAAALAWDSYTTSQKEAKLHSDNFKTSIDDMVTAIRDRANVAIRETRQAIADLKLELSNLGLSSSDQKIRDLMKREEEARRTAESNAEPLGKAMDARDRAKAEMERLEAAYKRAQGPGGSENQLIRTGRALDAAREHFDAVSASYRVLRIKQNEAIRVGRETAAAIDEAIKVAKEIKDKAAGLKLVEDAKRAEEDAIKEAQNRARRDAEVWGKFTTDTPFENRAALDEDVEKIWRDDAKARLDSLKFTTEAAASFEEDLSDTVRDLWKQDRELRLMADSMEVDDLEKKLDKKKALQRAFAEQTAAIAMEAIGVGVGATQTLFDEMITGQENALEHFGINVARQAGSALVGHGINLAGAAVVSSLTGAIPVAAAQGAGAAMLIGAGLGLGGFATGAEHVLGGGRIGQRIPDQRAEREVGANRARGSLGGHGGGSTQQVVLQFNYGLGVPKEKVARDMRDVQRFMEHGGYTGRQVRR